MTIIWSGLALGAVYALVAIGYNIVFLSQKTFNFAQAALMMLGAFLAYMGIAVMGLPWWIVGLAAGVIVGGIAALEERVAIRPVKDPHNLLVTTLGASLIMEGVAQVIWGGEPRRVPFFMGDQVLEVFGGRVYPVEIVLIVLVILIVVALTQYAKRSMTGIALLGMSEDREAARLRGVNVRTFAMVAFIFTGVLAGMLGVFVGPKTFAVATLGASLALKGFVVLAIGGFGSLWGVLAGGLIVGLAEALSSRYIGADFANLTIFAILILILMVKPGGLFTRRMERTV
ncbi:branched-chain amino acid ABC transporter permease [Microbacterium sp. zg.Y1090]|uniref:branched-chain amino acid ABC transporter permease n=1 Tax=Microbacterium TaxID=33882 RepID=UPI00214C968A|nr:MULTISPECIES: branched-chain amino acid ABC transporter permease [unclassified Microbacterium]MCR2813313.1 branched-chain amino acid ABC transporter permease [Microbacterium sp. zg.Y1084]MCR2819853.1 branched-chain amino acid ABC transporter permease [Microbacterium sp. zg.Y1090]MDL5487964.1 branched-chain amino acid ABC transporter permease [Microbacterium sp. zg-Y1211]WIM28590.1 branched-chain amino acid ABC transporter permease [Microbacterium sp. zg-Y1090]